MKKKKYTGAPLKDADGRQVEVDGPTGSAAPLPGFGVVADFEIGEAIAAKIERARAAGGGDAGCSLTASVHLDREGWRKSVAREYRVWVRGGEFQLLRNGGGRSRQTLGPFSIDELLSAPQPGGAPTNRERAEAALAGVLAYAAARDGSPPGHPDDERDAFRDLLSDMRHLADLRGWDFEEELGASGAAYAADAGAPPAFPGAPPGAGLYAGNGALGSLEPGHPHNPARAREAFHERATEEG